MPIGANDPMIAPQWAPTGPDQRGFDEDAEALFLGDRAERVKGVSAVPH